MKGDSECRDLASLYPDFAEQELQEAEESITQYLKLVQKISERAIDNEASDTNPSPGL